MHRNIILLISLFSLFLAAPVAAECVNFWPIDHTVATVNVLDIADGEDESVLFATSNGLSIFRNGKWNTEKSKTTKEVSGDLDAIPYDNFITAIDYDSFNNLWLGYSGAIQIYDGYTKPVTVYSEQKTLVSYLINDLQSLGDQMWIAAGDIGLFCYQGGEWIWVQPAKSGLLPSTVSEMAVDYLTNSLITTSYFTTHSDQCIQHIMRYDNEGNIYFDELRGMGLNNDMKHVVSSYQGGVYFFSQTDISLYNSKLNQAVHVLNVKDLGQRVSRINDLSATRNGYLIIGTNNGMYAYKDGIVTDHIEAKDMINSDVKKVFADAENRWWYVNKYVVGYYTKPTEYRPVISVELNNDILTEGITTTLSK